MRKLSGLQLVCQLTIWGQASVNNIPQDSVAREPLARVAAVEVVADDGQSQTMAAHPNWSGPQWWPRRPLNRLVLAGQPFAMAKRVGTSAPLGGFVMNMHGIFLLEHFDDPSRSVQTWVRGYYGLLAGGYAQETRTAWAMALDVFGSGYRSRHEGLGFVSVARPRQVLLWKGGGELRNSEQAELSAAGPFGASDERMDRQLEAPVTPSRSNRLGRTLWMTSLAALAVSNALDVRSSWGKRELNPVLADSSGAFKVKGALMKSGIQAAVIGVEYLILRRKPSKQLYHITALMNFGCAAAVQAVAIRNFTVPRP